MPGQAVPEAMESRTLKGALEDFSSNLSPRNKAAAAVCLVAVVLLVFACMRYLKGGIDNLMTLIWAAAIVVFGIAEAVTAGLVSIWFVVGSLAAMFAAMAGAGILAQVVVFIVVSAVALAATRPLVKKITSGKTVPTNADRVLGEVVRVTEEIDNLANTGAVYADGKTWSARSQQGEVIPAGTLVKVLYMEGVKLFVEKCEVMEEMK